MSFRPVSNGAGFRIAGIDSGAFGSLSSHPGSSPFNSPFSSPPSSKWGGVNLSDNTHAWNGIGPSSNSGNTPGWRDPLPPLGTGHVIDLPKHFESPPHSQPIGLPPARNVPEPGTLALLGIAMLGAACARRRKVT